MHCTNPTIAPAILETQGYRDPERQVTRDNREPFLRYYDPPDMGPGIRPVDFPLSSRRIQSHDGHKPGRPGAICILARRSWAGGPCWWAHSYLECSPTTLHMRPSRQVSILLAFDVRGDGCYAALASSGIAGLLLRTSNGQTSVPGPDRLSSCEVTAVPGVRRVRNLDRRPAVLWLGSKE